MKVGLDSSAWRLLSAALVVAVLGACGPTPEPSELTSEESPALEGETTAEEKSASNDNLAPPFDPYADAVYANGVVAVIDADQAVGMPDGQVASFIGLLGAALTLDMGAGEEGTGPLRIYYSGLVALSVIAQVQFLRDDFSVISTSQANLLNLGLGTFSVVVPYNRGVPYRYVRLLGGIASLYGIDAVEALSTVVAPGGGGGGGGGSAFCGDGVVAGAEQCDDGNLHSGDGCSSVCRVEPGYTCQGTHPSVCMDVDECAAGGGQHCPQGYRCVNAPGTYYCQPNGCLQDPGLSGCVQPTP
ncbi:DUF4215 domain-containing protein [Myxococcus sp. K15C18031901]|uniref:DUF4215 domain-containing protein n=1 Tax=Myxococcus dinghuensis TaxID=2906761 RepID=UPI0020A75111|nr:DUF4215 domain-containing protein [Myxococcus dinghuensis]MCP3102462.1 DUF4215 domain-containing protein [Myxococcus dinghuensis]